MWRCTSVLPSSLGPCRKPSAENHAGRHHFKWETSSISRVLRCRRAKVKFEQE